MTIGYESIRFDQLRDALLGSGTRLLIDVRAVASSRRAGFSKSILASGLAEAGIGYVHLRDLGTPKEGRDAVRRGDIATMQRVFASHMQADRAQAALAEAAALAAREPCCLLCFERDHASCHRTLVAEMITGQSPSQETAGPARQPIRHLRALSDLPEPPAPRRRIVR